MSARLYSFHGQYRLGSRKDLKLLGLKVKLERKPDTALRKRKRPADDLAKLPAKKKRRSPHGKSGKPQSQYVGVSWHDATKKWLATISVNKKKQYIGTYDNDEEAAKAVNFRCCELMLPMKNPGVGIRTPSNSTEMRRLKSENERLKAEVQEMARLKAEVQKLKAALHQERSTETLYTLKTEDIDE